MSISETNKTAIKSWLKNDVYPLWSVQGVDAQQGGFVESLSFSGAPQNLPRRAMVQSRQIYSFITGARMNVFPAPESQTIAKNGVDYMIRKFSQPSGAFRYSIHSDGSPKSEMPDLYTQAFALFGLAQGYSLERNKDYKIRALELVHYLQQQRQASEGGFTEIDEQNNITYKSNPHMHLFESFIAWIQVDNDPAWLHLAHDLATLALTKFIDSKTGLLGEYFDPNWSPVMESGRFVYEPGHQYEWAWLLSLYQELTGTNTFNVRHKLFQLAEEFGTSTGRKIVYDEMWSDLTPKKISSRFWPQGERIKAAVRLAHEVSGNQKAAYFRGADDALETLFKFLQTPEKGMWYDQLSETDTFSGEASKSSSLYHIINAMEEYVNLR